VVDERQKWERAMRSKSKSHLVTVKYFYDAFDTWEVNKLPSSTTQLPI
jgi:hypothetical protein